MEPLEELLEPIEEFFKGNQFGFKFLRVDVLAGKLGLHEAPLRFFIGILLGFPCAIIFLLLPKKAANFRHFYISLCGMLISYFCFGSDSVYPLISILITYISIVLFGGTIQNVVFNFIFQLSYMFGAYVIFSSDSYDVKWTTPQCILCLRLIGLAWDCYDGKRKKETLKAELLLTRYEGTPTFVEICGYSYFFGAFMAGPQFSFQRYIKFVEDRLIDKEGEEASNSRFVAVLKRTAGAVIMISLFLKYDPLYPTSALYKKKFLEQSFFMKTTQMTLTYHIHFLKYVSIWYLCESVCMITGLAYNGTKDGKAKWDGVRNFKFRKFMFGTFFQDMLESFNINTSQWASRYLFKRLIFLGNKHVSHALTLLFLSLWHGFYVGYFILFAIEFGLLIGERQLCGVLNKMTGYSYSDLPLVAKAPMKLFGIVFRAYSCGFAATAFMLLRWRRIKVTYAAVYYWNIWVIAAMFLFAFVLKKVARTATTKTEIKKTN